MIAAFGYGAETDEGLHAQGRHQSGKTHVGKINAGNEVADNRHSVTPHEQGKHCQKKNVLNAAYSPPGNVATNLQYAKSSVENNMYVIWPSHGL